MTARRMGGREETDSKFEQFSRYASEETDISPFQKQPHMLRLILLIFAAVLALGLILFPLLLPEMAVDLKNRINTRFLQSVGQTELKSSGNQTSTDQPLGELSGNQTTADLSGGQLSGNQLSADQPLGELSGNQTSTDMSGGESSAGQSSDPAFPASDNPAGGSAAASEPGAYESVPETEAPFTPHPTELTRPENQVEYTELEINGLVLEDISSYDPPYEISFSGPDEYAQAPGIFTFRGNNFRDDPTFGHTFIKENQVEDVWSVSTGSLQFQDALWTGSGWTGQPLMRMWTREEKEHMNMYDWAKSKDGMVELIYACMDGYVYFLDLETGEKTRDTIYLGYTFKGAGALDPRGYPLLYLGAGYNSNEGYARTFIVNLLDLSVEYTFGNTDPFSLRGTVSLFDASPLLDAETDTLIWPGENGILYLLHLNTQYDPEKGEIHVDPDRMVKWHYYGTRTSEESYWLGMETSPAVYQGYLFVADNGGDLFCLDLNSMELVWAADILDDSNSSPVLSMEDGHLYIYVSTSFHIGWRSSDVAPVPIWKIDAETGEKVWETVYDCHTIKGVSGGVQSTIALGKNELEGNIYVTVSMTSDQSRGVLACIDRTNGQVKWEHSSLYAWSSPVCVYNPDGSGRVLYCTSGGVLFILDGKSGDELCSYQISNGNIEASPAVWNSYLVVGTRSCRIRAVRLK